MLYIKWESHSLILKYNCELAESCEHTNKNPVSFSVLKHQTLTTFLKVMDDAIFFAAYDLSD